MFGRKKQPVVVDRKGRVINLTEAQVVQEQESRKTRWKLKLTLLLCQAVALCAGTFYISLVVSDFYYTTKAAVVEKWENAKFKLADKLDLVQYKVKMVNAKEVDPHDLIKLYAPKYGINPIVALPSISQESAYKVDGENPHSQYRIKFESGWKRDYAKKYPRQRWMNEEEWNMYFSSIGLFQISFAIWGDFCGAKNPFELMDPDLNTQCYMKIMAKCLYDHRAMKDSGQRLWTCYRDYNGSGPDAEAYADARMAKIASFAIADQRLINETQGQGLFSVGDSPEVAEAEVVPVNYEVEDTRLDIREDESGKIQVKEVPAKVQVASRSVKHKTRR